MIFRLICFCALVVESLLIPLTAHAANCTPPSWAPAALPGYVVASCDEKAWAALDLDLAAGSRTVAGQRSTINYELMDERKNATARAARDFYINQGRRNGATPMSRPDGDYAVLTKRTPQGEFWYLYLHGSGNEDTTGSYTLITLRVAALPQEVTAKPMTAPLDVVTPNCQDPPWLVRQFAYFQRQPRCEKKIWDMVSVDLPDGTRALEGRRSTVTYELTDQSKDPVALAVARNYVNALQAIGAKLASNPDSINAQAVLTQTTPSAPSGTSTSTAPETTIRPAPTSSRRFSKGRSCRRSRPGRCRPTGSSNPARSVRIRRGS